MISNGYQARLLHSDLVSIEETFALSTPSALSNTTRASSTASGPPKAESEAGPSSINLEGYSPAIRAKALSVLRSGAVYVEPITTAALSELSLPLSTTQSSKGKGATGDVFLAFRWIGAEHKNAGRASVLDDIAHADLERIHGFRLRNNTSGQVKAVAELSEKPSDKQRPASVGSLKTLKTFMKRRNSSATSPTLSRISHSSNHSTQNDGLLMQLYFDGRLIPLAKEDGLSPIGVEEYRANATLQARGGALLNLGPVASTKPDAPANEVLHTVTLHIWDVESQETDFALSVGEADEIDPKKIRAPVVIFHFEIVSSGPPSLDLPSLLASAAETPSTVVSSPVQVERVLKPMSPVTPMNIASLSEESFGVSPSGSWRHRLPSVAEVPEEELKAKEGSRFSTGRRSSKADSKAWVANSVWPTHIFDFLTRSVLAKGEAQDTQITAPSCLNMPETQSSGKRPLVGERKITLKERIARKVRFEKSSTSSHSRSQESLEGGRVDESTTISSAMEEQVSVPTPEASQPGSANAIPRDDRTSTPKPSPLNRIRLRKNSIVGSEKSMMEAKQLTLLGHPSSKREELRQTMKRAEDLTRKCVELEREKRGLEEQYTRQLLTSLDTVVHKLEQRVKEEEREIDNLRKKVANFAAAP